MMNARVLQFYLLAAEAAAAEDAAHGAEGNEPPKALLLKIQAQGTAVEPALRQGSGLAPTMGTQCLECECDKVFASKKAMFVHLQRDYNGATSPTINMAAAAATTAVEKKLWDLWEEAGLRGRPPVAPLQASRCCSSQEDQEEVEAAMTLLEMASHGRTSSETQQQSVEPVRAPNAASGQHIVKTSAVEQVVAVQVVLPTIPPIFPSLDSSAGDKKAKKRRVMNHPEEAAASTSPLPLPPKGAARTPAPVSGKTHTCRTCGKSFSTHQALGGHVSSSHVKGKTTSVRHDGQSAGNGNITIPDSAGAFQERQDAQPSPAQAPTPQTTQASHVCDVCSLTFTSGQALGGHMGMHRKPAAPVLEPEYFDLNELPGQGENDNQP
jgi:hypothetical protein|uniref:C2H2-type domain-containing protein n=1 Tax=Zea mays TaxID=4577 RepID=A0A804RK74_MAIZE